MLRSLSLAGSVALLAGFLAGLAPALAAEASYPFEGTWVRADHACTVAAVRARTYTARDVTSPRGRCSIRRVASNGNIFELLEDCHAGDRVTETIRMTSNDSLALKRQVNRLKIAHQVRYIRCSIAAPGATPGRPARAGGPDHPAEPRTSPAKP